MLVCKAEGYTQKEIVGYSRVKRPCLQVTFGQQAKLSYRRIGQIPRGGTGHMRDHTGSAEQGQ